MYHRRRKPFSKKRPVSPRRCRGHGPEIPGTRPARKSGCLQLVVKLSRAREASGKTARGISMEMLPAKGIQGVEREKG